MISYCPTCGVQLATTCSFGTQFCSNCGERIDINYWIKEYDKEAK